MSHNQDLPEYDAIDVDRIWHTFECDHDGCSSEVSGNGQFMDVWSKAKSAGWVAVKDSRDGWQHFCPSHSPRRRDRGKPLV